MRRGNRDRNAATPNQRDRNPAVGHGQSRPTFGETNKDLVRDRVKLLQRGKVLHPFPLDPQRHVPRLETSSLIVIVPLMQDTEQGGKIVRHWKEIFVTRANYPDDFPVGP